MPSAPVQAAMRLTYCGQGSGENDGGKCGAGVHRRDGERQVAGAQTERAHAGCDATAVCIVQQAAESNQL